MNLHRIVRRGLIAVALSLAPALAHAQTTPVYQTGTATANDALKIVSSGRVSRAGGLTGDANGLGLNPTSITDSLALGLCSNSADTLTAGGATASYNAFCLGHDSSGNALLTVDSYGGLANKALKIRIAGTTYDFPQPGTGGDVVGPASAVVGNLATFNATTGKLIRDSGISLPALPTTYSPEGGGTGKGTGVEKFTTTCPGTGPYQAMLVNQSNTMCGNHFHFISRSPVGAGPRVTIGGTIANNKVVGFDVAANNVTYTTPAKIRYTTKTGIVTTGTTTNGSKSVTVASATNLLVGQAISGTNIPGGATVTAISGTTLTISAAATGSGSGITLSFDDTTDSVAKGLANAFRANAEILAMFSAVDGHGHSMMAIVNQFIETNAGETSLVNFDYYFTTANNPTTGQPAMGTISANTTNGSPTVTNVSCPTCLTAGQFLGGNGTPSNTSPIPTDTYVVSVNSGAATAVLSRNATATQTGVWIPYSSWSTVACTGSSTPACDTTPTTVTVEHKPVGITEVTAEFTVDHEVSGWVPVAGDVLSQPMRILGAWNNNGVAAGSASYLLWNAIVHDPVAKVAMHVFTAGSGSDVMTWCKGVTIGGSRSCLNYGDLKIEGDLYDDDVAPTGTAGTGFVRRNSASLNSPTLNDAIFGGTAGGTPKFGQPIEIATGNAIFGKVTGFSKTHELSAQFNAGTDAANYIRIAPSNAASSPHLALGMYGNGGVIVGNSTSLTPNADGLVVVSGQIQLAGTSNAFGSLMRDGAGVKVIAGDGTTGAFLSGVEQSAPAAPAANGYRIFAQDNGAGKTQLMVIFGSGVAQQIAIEP